MEDVEVCAKNLFNAINDGLDVTRQQLTDVFLLEATSVDRIAPLLVTRNVESLRKAALYAILLTSNRLLTECILKFITNLELGSEDEGIIDSEDFPPHITPLILAGILDQHDTVRMLLNRGHSIRVPHRQCCMCDECVAERGRGEVVEASTRRIDAFRAMTSSAFLWNVPHDPLLGAFNLARDLTKCAAEEPELNKQYSLLSARVQRFAASLAEQCRSGDEVSRLLERPEQEPMSTGAQGFPQLPRFLQALDADMPDFLCSQNVQSLLRQRWMGGWANMSTTSSLSDWIFRYPIHTILYPITALLYVLSGGTVVKSYRYPFCRFLSCFTSYFVFLSLVVVMTQQRDLRQSADMRGYPDDVSLVLQIFLWLYLLGMVWWDFCIVCRVGCSRYFSVWWHWFDCFMYNLYFVAFLCWIYSGNITTSDELHNLTRKHWYYMDPHLLYEACYSTGAMLTVWRIFYFLQITRLIGPTVVSIGRCVQTMFNYLVVILVVVISFAVGINFLFENYRDNWVIENGRNETQPVELSHFMHTLRALYWAFYNYFPPETTAVIVGNIGPDRTPVEHKLTRSFGEMLSVIYHIITIIMLLNLMVSLLCATCDEVLKNEDREWKMVRCHIWAEFFEESNCVPPPFNLLYAVLSVVRDLVKGAKFVWPDVVYMPMVDDNADFANYQKLLLTFYIRYRKSQGDKFQTAPAFAVVANTAATSVIGSSS